MIQDVELRKYSTIKCVWPFQSKIATLATFFFHYYENFGSYCWSLVRKLIAKVSAILGYKRWNVGSRPACRMATELTVWIAVVAWACELLNSCIWLPTSGSWNNIPDVRNSNREYWDSSGILRSRTRGVHGNAADKEIRKNQEPESRLIKGGCQVAMGKKIRSYAWD